MARPSFSSDDEHLLLKHETSSLPLQQIKGRKSNVTLRQFALLALFSSAISIAMSLTMWMVLRAGAEPSHHRRLLPGLDIPPLGFIQKAFMPEPVYDDPRTARGKEAWMGLFPKGKGYVSVDNISAAGPLPDFVLDTSTDDTGRFSIATFHQLHCLFLLQSDLFEALDGNLTAPHSHTSHCLDYLRESILCSSDTTLEPFKSRFDSTAHRHGVDGYGTPHQCRDFNQLYKWAERFRYNDDKELHNFEG